MNMSPGSSSCNAPSRNGLEAAACTSVLSSTCGAVPKSKFRKKVSSHPNTYSMAQPFLSQPFPSKVSTHQLLSQVPQNSPTSCHFQCATDANSYGSLQPLVCNNIGKNQLQLDWQSRVTPSRIFRNQQTLSDLFDSASDEGVSLDNRHTLSGFPFGAIFPEVNESGEHQATLQYNRLRMNRQDVGKQALPSLPSSEVSSDSLSLNNSAPIVGASSNLVSSHCALTDPKKINVASSPDRTEVEQRLHQIQDYIKQTSSLIESYRLSTVTQPEVSGLESSGRVIQSLETQANGNDHAIHAPGPHTVKSNETKKQSEIKKKFEESLRQLNALQAEQTLLIQKRSEAQEQLQEVQKARNILFGISSNGCPLNLQGDSVSDVRSHEHLTDTLVNNFQDVNGQITTGRSKTQVSPRRELPHKKGQAFESCQADPTTFLKELLTGDEVKEQASSEDSAVEDAIDDYAEARAQVRLQGQIVQDKVSEINALRAQLDQAKSFLNISQKTDVTSLASGHSSADEVRSGPAVAMQRQWKLDADVTDTRKFKTTIKEQLLDQERAQLERLRGLLATVQEFRAAGLPIPDHILSEFNSEAQSDVSCDKVPVSKEISEEDAAVEADAEEDDEPESTTQWNQEHVTLIESASMANELSQGLQQRAAQLQVERDGLNAMQRQLDGLFNQLHLHRSVEKPIEDAKTKTASSSASALASPLHHMPKVSGVPGAKRDETLQRRLEVFSDFRGRWQLLQEEIALDEELSTRAAPVLNAAQSALNILASQIVPEDHLSILDRGVKTPQSESIPQGALEDWSLNGCFQMSSAPSTLTRRKSPVDAGQRAMWSSSRGADVFGSENNISEPASFNPGQVEDNPPIVSLPSSTPTTLQQQTQLMKNRIEALSQSCQSIGVESSGNMNPNSALPLLPSVTVPSPPAVGSSSHDREMYYQQLLAAGQFQQHQVLLTAVNQCFHILKMQQQELSNLSNSVHILSSSGGHFTHVRVHPGVHQAVHQSTLPVSHSGVSSGVHQGVHPRVHPGLLANDEQWATPSPAPGPCPPTLNNQVPPGNRTNNYWDNFRSYSRQNLLSTTTKSNEGLPHSPSPLVERSHNSLRSSTPVSVPGPNSISVASTIPQFHSVSSQPCVPPMVHHSGLSESGGASIGAVGPLPLSTAECQNPPLMQNISRNDKRNVDYSDREVESPRRCPLNEIDHHTASRVLEEAALPLNSQMISPAAQDFEVPSMPILRNSVASLQSRFNHINLLNAPPSFQDFVDAQNTRHQLNNEGAPFNHFNLLNAPPSFQDYFDAQTSRHQLNNEGVPFSEIATSISTQQSNEFGDFCSLDHSRRLNVDFQNGASEDELTNSLSVKRNTGAIKRTYTVAQGNTPVLTQNYQRNIHSSSGVSHSSSNNCNNIETSIITSKLASVFPMCSSESETVFKSSKQQLGQDSSRNFNCTGRRPSPQEDLENPCQTMSVPSRLRMRGINEVVGHPLLHRHVPSDSGDPTIALSVGFNNSQSSASSQSSSSQNTTNVDVHGVGPVKNQLNESAFQVRKGPKYQPKLERRNPFSDSVVGTSVAANAQNPSVHHNVHTPTSSKQSGFSSPMSHKNNQDFNVPNQMRGQGQVFEELRESLYAEMTSLISASERRSHFLVQLLKDLQHIGSDSVRQCVLQLIQQAVDRYQIDLSALSQSGFPVLMENEAEDDEDEAKRLESHRLGKGLLPFVGPCSSSKTSTLSTQEGETLMQLVVGLELSAVLSTKADENCSTNLIDDVRNRIFHLLPNTVGIHNMPSSSSVTHSASYLCAQIDNVLECIIQKYQGQRIGDVKKEITSFVLGALPIKLMYCSMVEFYSHSNMETVIGTKRDALLSPRENEESLKTNPLSPSSLQFPLRSPPLFHEGGGDTGIGNASNGDLAEADQSHHIANGLDGDENCEIDQDCSVDGPLLTSESESSSTLLHAHAFSPPRPSETTDSEPEVEGYQSKEDSLPCAVGNKASCRNDFMGAVGGVVNSSVEENCLHETSEPWSSGQDREKKREREQGLDQVPTRLACDNDRDHENGEKNTPHHSALPPNDQASNF